MHLTLISSNRSSAFKQQFKPALWANELLSTDFNRSQTSTRTIGEQTQGSEHSEDDSKMFTEYAIVQLQLVVPNIDSVQTSKESICGVSSPFRVLVTDINVQIQNASKHYRSLQALSAPLFKLVQPVLPEVLFVFNVSASKAFPPLVHAMLQAN
jgi:hypothetical protein